MQRVTSEIVVRSTSGVRRQEVWPCSWKRGCTEYSDVYECRTGTGNFL